MSERTDNRQFRAQAGAGAPAKAECGNCQFFCNRPSELEFEFPQLRTLGSVYGSVRSQDGLCQRLQRYLGSASHCAAHEPRAQILG